MEPLSILPALRQEAQRLFGMGRDGGAALPGAAFGEAGTEGGHWARSLLPVSAQQFLHPHTDSIPPSPHQFQYPQTNSCIPSPTPASPFRPPHPNSSIPTPIPASPDRLLHPQTNSCLPTLTQFQLPTPIPASPPRLPPPCAEQSCGWLVAIPSVARGHSQAGPALPLCHDGSIPFPAVPPALLDICRRRRTQGGGAGAICPGSSCGAPAPAQGEAELPLGRGCPANEAVLIRGV